jgi:hypothetical protein
MTDTPQHIKELQLKIWLSKPPMERLRQMMEDNDSLFRFWANTKRTDTHTTESNFTTDQLPADDKEE